MKYIIKGKGCQQEEKLHVAVIVPAVGYEIQNILAEKERSSVLWELAWKEKDTKIKLKGTREVWI